MTNFDPELVRVRAWLQQQFNDELVRRGYLNIDIDELKKIALGILNDAIERGVIVLPDPEIIVVAQPDGSIGVKIVDKD